MVQELNDQRQQKAREIKKAIAFMDYGVIYAELNLRKPVTLCFWVLRTIIHKEQSHSDICIMM